MCTHAYSRMKKFLLNKYRDYDIVYNTLQYLFNADNISNAELLISIQTDLLQMDWTNRGKGYFWDTKSEYAPAAVCEKWIVFSIYNI